MPAPASDIATPCTSQPRLEDGDELHHFGWNRCSSACHGPDRSHLIVPGFRSSRLHVDPEDVAAGHYGSRLHFWNLAEQRVEQTVELGDTGLVPLEVRWLHDPDTDQGFVGAALSSTMSRLSGLSEVRLAVPFVHEPSARLASWEASMLMP